MTINDYDVNRVKTSKPCEKGEKKKGKSKRKRKEK
jgi:hypothetical protein